MWDLSSLTRDRACVLCTGRWIFCFCFFWLLWVFVAARGFSLVLASGGYSSLRCTGFSLRWLLLLRSTGSRRTGSVIVAHGLQSAGSVVVAHRLSCSAACGIFPDQGLNLCPLHWQADQGSPTTPVENHLVNTYKVLKTVPDVYQELRYLLLYYYSCPPHLCPVRSSFKA